MDFLKTTANTPWVISLQTSLGGTAFVISCSAVSLKKKKKQKKTWLHLLPPVENFLHLRETQLPEMTGELGTLTNKLASYLHATKHYHLL